MVFLSQLPASPVEVNSVWPVTRGCYESRVVRLPVGLDQQQNSQPYEKSRVSKLLLVSCRSVETEGYIAVMLLDS